MDILKHLQRFHLRIFGDVFPWAGQLRTIPIFKDTGFCLPQHIESYANGEFAKLAAEDFLRGLSANDFVAKLAYYHAEINELHPFREGNGRAQRAFLSQLAKDAGYRLNWSAAHPDENHAAALAAHSGDLGPLSALLARVVDGV